MAQREALLELQTRLAQRMKAAHEATDAASWLAVQAGGRPFLLPLGQSGEIVPWTAPRAVPFCKPWYKGVINLRGSVQGVVDLAEFLASHAAAATLVAPEAAAAVPAGGGHLVSFNPLMDLNCSLRVDALLGLRQLGALTLARAAPAEAMPGLGAVFADDQGRHWQVLDLGALAHNPLFLDISV